MLNKLKKIIKKAGISKLKIVYISVALIIFALSFFAFSGFSLAKFVNSVESDNSVSTNQNDFQEVVMDLTYDGYNPNVFYIRRGASVRWNINVKQMTGCTNEIMIESLGIRKNLEVGKNIIEFSAPDGVDEIKFSCGMKMVWGKFVITENGTRPIGSTSVNEANNLPNGGCNGSCGGSSCGAAKGGSCGCGKH